MTGCSLNLRRMPLVLMAIAVAASVAGCGKTLVFAERDGVNISVRANATSAPPIEANFGLNRTIATIVPPAGEAGNRPDGDAVSMLASFQVDNTLVPTAPLNADLEISTQFASGQPATIVAQKPDVVVAIVNPTAGAQLAARTNADVEVIIAAIVSCDGKMDFSLRNKLIDAAALGPASDRLKTRETPDEFRAAIRNSPGLVSSLRNAAIKQGRAQCPKQ